MNRMILIGRLTADPELKTTPKGTEVSAFTLAVDRDYTPKGQQRQADFIPCVAWEKTAAFISRYFTKGQRIAVEGRLQSRRYEDKQGNPRTAYEMVIERAFFCSEKSEQKPTAGLEQPDGFEGYEEIADDTGLPF